MRSSFVNLITNFIKKLNEYFKSKVGNLLKEFLRQLNKVRSVRSTNKKFLHDKALNIK